MRVSVALTVVFTMILVSCAQSVSGDNNPDTDMERRAAPGGDRSIWLAGDSRVYLAPGDFLLVYNSFCKLG